MFINWLLFLFSKGLYFVINSYFLSDSPTPDRPRADEARAGEGPNLENNSLCQGDPRHKGDCEQGPLGDDSGNTFIIWYGRTWK